MKRFIAVIALVLLTASACFALSDKEYLKMRKNSSAYAQADKKLNRVWSSLRKSLPKSVFAELEKLQHEWITSGRDDDAKHFMDDGYSKVEAYTIATTERAEALPEIAKDLRRNKSKPAPAKKPAKSPAPAPKPKPAPEPDPEPDEPAYNEPDPENYREEDESQSVIDPSGEYESENCFMTVKIIDRSSMEVEVTFARWKDEINWKASGWYDNNMLELSDPQYSECQVTITFDPDRARVVPSESEDWATLTADDFKIRGTYTKKQ